MTPPQLKRQVELSSFHAILVLQVDLYQEPRTDRFPGRVLLATGAGSGIGAATARRYAAEGGRVAVADLDLERAEAVATELEGSIALACDVSDEEAVQQAVAEVQRRLGRIDAVLNSAGYVKFAPIEELSLEDWNR